MTHGLDIGVVAVAAACVVLWSLLSARLGRLYISAPIVFLVMRLLVTHGPLAIIHLSPHSSTIRSLAEATVALVLFTDASRVNVHELRRNLVFPSDFWPSAFLSPLALGRQPPSGLFRVCLFGWQRRFRSTQG